MDFFDFDDVDGLDPNEIKMFSLDSDGKRYYGFKDNMNHVTPLFNEVLRVMPYNDKSALIFAKVNDDKVLYSISASSLKDVKFCERVNIDTNINDIIKLDNDTLIIRSDAGEYLFDTVNLKRKSDIFDKILLFNNKLLFKKTIKIDENHTYYGRIFENGHIGHNIYVEDCDAYISTPIVSDDSRTYDVLDLDELEVDAKKRENKRKHSLDERMKILVRLNMERK